MENDRYINIVLDAKNDKFEQHIRYIYLIKNSNSTVEEYTIHIAFFYFSQSNFSHSSMATSTVFFIDMY